MNKILPTLCAAAGIFVATLTSAQAAADPAFGNMGASFSANIGITNNYVWRGITQTNDDFAVQGGADVEFDSGFSLGVWASNVDFGDGTEAEIDLYGSYSIPLTEMVSANVGAIGYFFAGQPSGADYTFFEGNVGLDFDLGMATLSTSVAYSPDVGNETTWYFNSGLGIPLSEIFEVFGGVGYYQWESSPNIIDYNIGVSATWGNFTVSTYYAGTDIASDNGSFVVMLTAAVP